MAMVILLLIILSGCALYLRFVNIRYRELPVLVLMFSFLFFLHRFNYLVVAHLGDRPLLGIHLYIVTLVAAFLLMRMAQGRPGSRLMAFPIGILALFALFSFLSGFINGGTRGFFPVVQILIIALGPPLLAWLLFELSPVRMNVSRLFRRNLIAVLGVATPLLLIITALKPDIFGAVLGWESPGDLSGAGFVRGWSPIGSTICTGSLIVIAYGFALHEAVFRNSIIHVIVATLTTLSILFTGSRSVMLIFMVFNLVYWPLVGKWTRFLRISAIPFFTASAGLVWDHFDDRISFGRFLVTEDNSLDIRWESLKLAWRIFLEEPWMGRGPGLLYEEIRKGWLLHAPGDVPDRVINIGNAMSAAEPHNLYLFLCAEHGLIASVFFIAAMVYGLVVVIRVPVSGNKQVRSERALYIGLWISMLVIFGTASWPLVNPQFSVFFWIFIFSGIHWSRIQLAVRSNEVEYGGPMR